ncbi:MAG: hypothetical protein Kow00109_03540 [Acidobacteriota bacterium]
MRWGRLLTAGAVGGVGLSLANLVQHGVVMASAYAKYPIFDVEPVNPVWFLFVDVCTGIGAVFLFGVTRRVWCAGWKGGLQFGLLLGLAVFFPNFHYPLVLKGFPYHLSWCWGGIGLIGYAVMGTLFGLVYGAGED